MDYTIYVPKTKVLIGCADYPIADPLLFVHMQKAGFLMTRLYYMFLLWCPNGKKLLGTIFCRYEDLV